MRTVLRIGMVVCLMVVAAIPAFGKGAPNIRATIHNLSTTAPDDPFFEGTSFYRSNEDEVCVFCHTPHGGSLTGPLWNRTNPTTSWTHYTSSTLSSQVGGSTRAVNPESLLCLSCHDGSISVYHIINPSNDGPTPIQNAGTLSEDVRIVDLWETNGALVAPGGDLSDDHPISFSYQSVISSYPYTDGSPKSGQLRPIGDEGDSASALGWKGEGVRFFGSNYRVECSSCHDPHVDYSADADYAPFLIRPNTGSDLCLSCHVK